MTPEEIKLLVDKFKTLTFASMAYELDKGALTLETFIKKQIIAGVNPLTIQQTLVRDMEAGGQIFGSLKSAFKHQVAWGIEGAEDGALKSETGLQDDTPSDWVAIADQGTCDDCLDRANSGSHPYSYWVGIGLPGTGNTICGDYCRCDVVPSGAYTDEMKANANARYYEEKYNKTHDKQITYQEAQVKVGQINE